MPSSRIVNEGRHTAGRLTERAKNHAWANKFFQSRNLPTSAECRFAVATAQHIERAQGQLFGAASAVDHFHLDAQL
jgi:hypothetical protein